MKSPFVWGQGGRAMTPEDVERERQLVALARAKMGDTSPVGHWTQGATRVVDALGGVLREKRTNKAEDAGMAGADAYVQNDPVLSALIGGGDQRNPDVQRAAVSAAEMPSFTPDPNAALAGDAMAALGKSTPATPEAIRAGLVARGLPEHVADGFVMNFQDESGLNPGINEINPIVPGSRGGFGLYQLTGPRRRAYEAYAAERGVPLDSVDAQLDFMMMELQGPESRAAEAILSTKDAGEAGAAIVNEFLRPSPEYAAKRASEYLGGGGYAGGGMSAGGAPIPMAGGGADVASALAAAMSDPWVAKKYGPVLDALMGQEMKRSDMQYQAQLAQSDPMYQAQLAQLTAPQAADPFAGTMEIGGVLYGPDGQGGFVPLITPQGGMPDAPETQTFFDETTGQEYRAQWNGQEWVRIGGTKAPSGPLVENNIGGDGAIPDLGKLSTDYGYLTNPDGSIKRDPVTGLAISAPVPNSPADREQKAAAAKEANKDNQGQLKLGTTLESINLNLAEIENGGLPVTGWIGDARRTGLGRALTGDSAVDFGNRTNQITDQAALAEVQNMRDNSPTGGAVGSLTDSERVAIGNSVTAINNSTSAEEYARAAKAYRKLALDIAYGAGKWELTPEGEVVTKNGVATVSSGPTGNKTSNGVQWSIEP